MNAENPTLPLSLEQGIKKLREFLKVSPTHPGVYRMVSAKLEVLYVGKAKNLKKRLISYTQPQRLPHRLKRMVSQINHVEVTVTNSEIEALLLENNQIKKFQPPYNILLKDDKSFPFILITKDHAYPRISYHRGKKSDQGHYFGPFASAQAVFETIQAIQKVFMVRNCEDPYFQAHSKRPCLQYHIKQCTAPCTKKISEGDYKELINQAISFLKGKSDQVQQFYAQKMHDHSHREEYEKAAFYRDRIQTLTKIQARQQINLPNVKDTDVIAAVEIDKITCIEILFFRNGQNFGTHSFFMQHSEGFTLSENLEAFLGQFYLDRTPPPQILLNHPFDNIELITEAFKKNHNLCVKFEVPQLGPKKNLVDYTAKNAKMSLRRKIEGQDIQSYKPYFNQIAQLLDLSKAIERIEIYDNSHLFGKQAYGAMVVANSQGFDKKSYRKFSFEKDDIIPGDDLAMMAKLIERRFKHSIGDHEDEWPVPDLLLIDGGQNQVNIVKKVLDSYNLTLPILGIAKGPKRNAGQERFFTPSKQVISFPDNDPLLYFFQRLRDEAHRFAIGTHRKKRIKSLSKSSLDQIPGIGGKRKKLLLHHFGSSDNVTKASLEDLLIVPGINKTIAKIIFEYFHSTN